MQSLGASHALEDGHRVSADAANIAIVKRTPEVQRVGIDVLEEFLCIVLLDAFGVEVSGAVGC